MSTQPKQVTFRTVFPITLSIIFAAITLLLLIIRPDFRLLIIACVTVSLITPFFSLYLYLKNTTHPQKALVANMEELNEKAIFRLVTSLSEITKGNIGSQISYTASPIDMRNKGNLGLIISSYNSIVASVNRATLAFNSVTEIPSGRLCYIGADDYRSGGLCAKLLGNALKGKGRIGVIAVDNVTNYSTLREQGFLRILEENFPEIKVIHTVMTQRKPELTEKYVREMLMNFPDLDGVYQLEEATILTTLKVLAELRKPGELTFICHGINQNLFPYYEKGYITSTATQSPYLQGYNPLMYAYNHIVVGWKPIMPKLYITPDVTTQGNFREKIGRDVETSGLVEAVRARGHKKLKFTYFIPKEHDFWPPVMKGAEDAKKLLANKNVDVTIVQPVSKDDPILKGDSYNIERWLSRIEEAVGNGADAIALPVFNNSLIAMINSVVMRGVVVVTYNQEPSSLREMVKLISEQASTILHASHELANGALESSVTTNEMRDALNHIIAGTSEQNKRVDLADNVLKSFLNTIDVVIRESGEMSRKAHLILKEVVRSKSSVQESKNAVYGVETSAENTRVLIKRLSQNSDEIGSITAFIEDITQRTDLLAVNASIVAAHAGEQGKGFLVVAAEMRKLAEQSAKATDRITNLIKDIQNSIAQAFERSETEMAQVLNSKEQAELAEESLKRIDDSTSANVLATDQVISLLTQMSADSQTVRDAMISLSQINASNTASIEEISAAAEEMASGAASVRDTAQRLAGMAEAQETLLSDFHS